MGVRVVDTAVRVVWSAGARTLTASYQSALRLINLALWPLLHLSLSAPSSALLAISPVAPIRRS